MKLVISFSYSILLNCKIKKQRSLFVGELYCGREIEIRVYPFNFENAHEDFFKGIKRSRSCKNPNIHNKSTCPILELNFLRILSRKRQSCRNLADPRTRDSSRLYICIEKTRKKRRKEKKKRCVRSKMCQVVESFQRSASFPACFSFVTRPFFRWVDGYY